MSTPQEGQPVEVRINGDSYYLLSDGRSDEAEIRSLAEDVDNRIREVSRANSRLSRVEVAVLVAMNLAEELRRERGDIQEIRLRLARLSRNLEDSL